MTGVQTCALPIYGFGVVGTYTYDIAVSRVEITKNIAKQNGFPLRVEIEQSE